MHLYLRRSISAGVFVDSTCIEVQKTLRNAINSHILPPNGGWQRPLSPLCSRYILPCTRQLRAGESKIGQSGPNWRFSFKSLTLGFTRGPSVGPLLHRRTCFRRSQQHCASSSFRRTPAIILSPHHPTILVACSLFVRLSNGSAGFLIFGRSNPCSLF